ncbi:MAG: ferrous iron transporter B [Desulfobacteraceae bacterium]|nr:ferrous iron transporter B [Desulfobacteraceae bacterium]
MKQDFAIIGNMNVGKSTLFSDLSHSRSRSVNIPGITMSVKSGHLKGIEGYIYDTPGGHSIFSSNEDERATRDLLLIPGIRDNLKGIIFVVDAKNLKHSLAMFFQFAEYGLPMVLNVNMVDEAASRGIDINFSWLWDLIQVPVTTTIANEKIGVENLKKTLDMAIPVQSIVEYPEPIEEFIFQTNKIIPSDDASYCAIALLLLTGDAAVESYLSNTYGDKVLRQLKDLTHDCRQKLDSSPEIFLENLYHKEAAKTARQVQEVTPPARSPFILAFGDLCTKLSTGIPIALSVVVMMYLFIGSFAATFLVNTINVHIFENFLTPLAEKLVSYIPNPFVRDLIMNPDFGILPTGVFLALGLVLPVIFCFYVAFGFLEDSGYLPRLSILLDRVFKTIGLNGKGVIPLVMGFSCITMSILTTRILNSEKEKNIASFLVFLCMPCAPLFAVMLVILDKMPFYATIFVFAMIFVQILIAGFLANKILPGIRSAMIMEIPAMRIPKPFLIIKMAARKSWHFIKEAVPVFIYAAAGIFLFQKAGGLEVLENTLGPTIDQVLGLPEKSIQVFIKTMIRRESGAAELEHLAYGYSNLQLVVNLLVMTFIAPCINAIIVLFKERGMKAGTAIMTSVVIYAIIIGSAVNHICKMLGITFT